jgi:thiosulfate dehydrogenase [quinone] large subunit
MRTAMKTPATDFELGYLVLRLATGIDLVGHGAVRLFWTYQAFHSALLKSFASSPLPEAVVTLTARVVPPLELLLGLALTAGWQTRRTLLVASGLMFALILGSCLLQTWDIVAIQLFYVLVYSVLLAFRKCNAFSLDRRVLGPPGQLK